MRLRHARWLLLLPIGLFIGYQLSSAPPDRGPTHKAAQSSEKPPRTTSASAQKPVRLGTPSRLEIPKLDISAPIVPVGVTPANDMDVPRSAHEIGWYKFGAIPGRPDNAVLAGHLGLKKEPAVFWNLDKLTIGDTLSVHDAKHQKVTFRVTGKVSYTPQDAPRERIFGKTDSANLNLITCNGTYVQERDDYAKRLVVFTQALD